MLKRVVMIGLALGVALATQPVGNTQAGNNWVFVQPPGMWWNFGTVHGCASIGRVPNPDTKPALLQCDVELTRIETLCANPAGNEVAPGESALQVITSSQFRPENLDQKEKGKANICVSVDEAAAAGSEALCVNPNWHLTAALTTDFKAICTTGGCTDQTCTNIVVANTKVCSCTLPPGYSVLNPPTACADPLHPDPSCTAYNCIELDAQTGVPTGQLCEL